MDNTKGSKGIPSDIQENQQRPTRRRGKDNNTNQPKQSPALPTQNEKDQTQNMPENQVAPKQLDDDQNCAQQEVDDTESPGMLGKRSTTQMVIESNPLNAMMIFNLNQSHNTQRRRDIKQNYKAKLPLDKLQQEHQKKQQQLVELMEKRTNLVNKIKGLWTKIGQKKGVSLELDINLADFKAQTDDKDENTKIEIDLEEPEQDYFEDQTEVLKRNQGKNHWDFLLKELQWMADDFDKESKKKRFDSKKFVRNCKKHIHEKKVNHEKQQREIRLDLKRRSKFMNNIVQLYWKSCEKIVKHNYNVDYEKKRQALRTKKLENFVTKHLKLSVKVAEQLNTKQFVEQSQYKPDANAKPLDQQDLKDQNVLQLDDGQKQIKIYDSQEEIQMAHLDKEKKEEEKEIQGGNGFFQPTGTTLDDANVMTKVPFLLRGQLREYQIIGMDWMVTLHNRKLNGILADEMGLGKTIQTISLLASLACDKGIWGPHLIVVPTTIIMNWEMEFKKWCPGMKILTYFGSQKERKIKRHGWSKDNSFHVCITSYKLVIQDHFAFRRKKWYYMILDEAQNIKNFKSQRWQTMLKFNTKRRLLLTGTPLQNDVMELWSLMHFLMPNIFSNQNDFKEWFSNPFSQSVNQNKGLNLRVVQKLQSILRPFLLRRMKRDVEKQLPEKIEHIVQCNLSRRQRLLYDEYINMDKTRNVLADSDFFSIMSVLMQLRKVCNHPDLFEARSIESPFILTDQDQMSHSFPGSLLKELDFQKQNQDYFLQNMGLRLIDNESKTSLLADRQIELIPSQPIFRALDPSQYLIGSNTSTYESNFISQSMMQNRPFQDGLAVSQKKFTNCNVLARSNCSKLKETIPNIMPYDFSNYKMKYHKVPQFLQPGCIPFSQEYFSLQSHDQLRHSNYDGPHDPIETYKSAVQQEEKKQMMINMARKLALWHSIDVHNRIAIMGGKPIYGEDLRQSVSVSFVCDDVFSSKKFKYINWKRIKNKQNLTNDDEMFQMPSAVFNPCCTYDSRINQRNVIITDWPWQSNEEIEQMNDRNLFVKEISCQTLQEIKKRKEQREHEEKMRQPKKVHRKREVQIEYTEQQFNIYIDMEKINQEAEQFYEEENPNISFKEEEIVKIKTQTRSYEETITYAQYLDEQRKLKQEKLQEVQKQKQMENKEQQDEQIQQVEENKDESPDQPKEAQEPVKVETQKTSSSKTKEETSNFLSVSYRNTDLLQQLIISPMQRASMLEEVVKNFKIIIPKVVAKSAKFVPSRVYTKNQKEVAYEKFVHQKLMQHKNVNQSLKYSNILFFPHRNLIQYDCGKLQKMAQLLKTLYNKGSKVIIFTQMTRMLDIFEQFLNLHGYIYVRLDGSVKTENRQKLVDRFNYNKKIFCFISSTRCGGVGINLTGADCVIFYDTDWNPSMDKQAQDRCHRIGQTKTVHIYRLISINTIEENIFKKSLQKRELGGLIIEGNFNQEFFQKVSVKDILTMDGQHDAAAVQQFKPKKLDIFKHENIVFEDINAPEKPAQKDGDTEMQPDQEEQNQHAEQYRKRFEEALIQIEDQEDVDAMQVAEREMNINDDEDLNEFDENQVEGEGGDQPGGPKSKEEIQESLRQKEVQSKQNVNEGIGLTQGEIKKTEIIDWNENPNLNHVTKMCLNKVHNGYNFEEYLNERAQKDPKFVDIREEHTYINSQQQNTGEAQAEQQSEFSFSDEDLSTKGNSAIGKQPISWDRSKAEIQFLDTRCDIDLQLVQGAAKAIETMYFSQQVYDDDAQIPVENAENDNAEMQEAALIE